MIRILRIWTAGRLLHSQWTYRLSELDGRYLLEVKPEHEPDESYTLAVGHIVALRVAESLIEEDREWVRAEDEAYLEDEDRGKVVEIETARRSA